MQVGVDRLRGLQCLPLRSLRRGGVALTHTISMSIGGCLVAAVTHDLLFILPLVVGLVAGVVLELVGRR